MTIKIAGEITIYRDTDTGRKAGRGDGKAGGGGKGGEGDCVYRLK